MLYRNKEKSQGTLEAETDEARSKDLKMHVTENNEISSKGKSTTNLDLARDRQIRRKITDGNGTGIEPAPRCGTHCLAETRAGT